MRKILIKIVDWLFSPSDNILFGFLKTILLFGLFIVGTYVVMGVASAPLTILIFVVFFGGEYIYNLIPSSITNNDFFAIEAALLSGLLVVWSIFLILSIVICFWDFFVKNKKYSLEDIFLSFYGSIKIIAQFFLGINAMFFSVFLFFYFIKGLFGF